jgi:hypothetical protein
LTSGGSDALGQPLDVDNQSQQIKDQYSFASSLPSIQGSFTGDYGGSSNSQSQVLFSIMPAATSTEAHSNLLGVVPYQQET